MSKKAITRPFKVKSADSATGIFTGYASVFGELDSYRDIVMPGAFAKSLRRFKELTRKVPMLWQHDPRTPIGVYTELAEDDTGLLVTGQCNMDVQQGRECHALMAQEALTGLSIGYNTVRDEWDEKGMARKLFEVDLWEISPVTFPAGDSARVDGVKSVDLITSLSDAEAYLRDAGMSKSEATAFVSRVKRLDTRSESVASDEASIRKALATLRSIPR